MVHTNTAKMYNLHADNKSQTVLKTLHNVLRSSLPTPMSCASSSGITDTTPVHVDAVGTGGGTSSILGKLLQTVLSSGPGLINGSLCFNWDLLSSSNIVPVNMESLLHRRPPSYSDTASHHFRDQ